jgi:hypothetical protein
LAIDRQPPPHRDKGELIEAVRDGRVLSESTLTSRINAARGAISDRPPACGGSPHPNLVTASGLEALTNAMSESRTAYDAAKRIEDAGEPRCMVAVASRDMRYFADRLRTCQLVASPAAFSAIAFRIG